MSNFVFGRIAKFIAAAGVCSRRQAEKLIGEGRVKIDGIAINTPAINVGLASVVEIDNKLIKPAEAIRLWAYYKPVGLITTHRDPGNRPTVFDALKGSLPGVISIGRLDIASEGLLLLTNSGAVANNFESPKNNIERVYKVRVYGEISSIMACILQRKYQEIKVSGITYRPREIRLISMEKTNSWFEIVLTEGKNREVRKIFEHFSLRVNRLIRISYGKYKLGGLKPREFKEVEYP